MRYYQPLLFFAICITHALPIHSQEILFSKKINNGITINKQDLLNSDIIKSGDGFIKYEIKPKPAIRKQKNNSPISEPTPWQLTLQKDDNSLREIESVLKSRKSVNHNLYDGNTLFLISCGQHSIDRAKLAIKYGANLLQTNNQGDNCLHWTTPSSTFTTFIVKELIKAKQLETLINKKNKSGQSPLHYAASYPINDPASVETLIYNGANVNQTDNENRNVAFYAAINQNWKTLNILIDNGADLNFKSNTGINAHDLILRRGVDLDFYR